MKISAIIPALNEADRIAGCIDRAWQAGVDEVIVVDGHSRDETAAIAASCRCLILSTDPGRARQQNLGAQTATGDVLLFLHADTWLAPQSARQIEPALSDEQVPGGAFRQHIEADGLIYRLLEWGNTFRARRLCCPYGDQGIFLRREVFDRLGGFPDVKLMEDVLLMKALRPIGRPIVLPGPLHVSPRRWQANGPVRQTLRNWWLLGRWKLGASPDDLAQHYPSSKDAATAADPQKP